LRGDTGEELARAEGLDQIRVGARFEPFDAGCRIRQESLDIAESLLRRNAAWAIVTLRSLGTKMAQLNAHHDLTVSARALKWRILLSNIVTNVVMVLALTAVYRMAIHLVYTHELNS
jgi:hypothetical protein